MLVRYRAIVSVRLCLPSNATLVIVWLARIDRGYGQGLTVGRSSTIVNRSEP